MRVQDRFGQPVEPGVLGHLHLAGQNGWEPTGHVARIGPDGRVSYVRPVAMKETAEAAQAPFVEPRNPVEEVVAAVWREVLETADIGVLDDFFELGGHSIVAMQIISRLHGIFQVKVPVLALFEDPTVAGVCTALTALEPRAGQTETIARIWQDVAGALAADSATEVL
jgi:acyl carrier protein